jgi:hypothetical protein
MPERLDNPAPGPDIVEVDRQAGDRADVRLHKRTGQHVANEPRVQERHEVPLRQRVDVAAVETRIQIAHDGRFLGRLALRRDARLGVEQPEPPVNLRDGRQKRLAGIASAFENRLIGRDRP